MGRVSSDQGTEPFGSVLFPPEYLVRNQLCGTSCLIQQG